MNVIKANIKKILVGQLKNFQVNEDFIELILYFIIGAFDKIVFFIYTHKPFLIRSKNKYSSSF